MEETEILSMHPLRLPVLFEFMTPSELLHLSRTCACSGVPLPSPSAVFRAAAWRGSTTPPMRDEDLEAHAQLTHPEHDFSCDGQVCSASCPLSPASTRALELEAVGTTGPAASDLSVVW